MPPPLELGAGRWPGCRDGFYLWPAGYACFPGEDAKIITITSFVVLAVATVITIGSVTWTITQCSAACNKCAEEHRGPTALKRTSTEVDANDDNNEVIDIGDDDLCEMYPHRCEDGVTIPVSDEDERDGDPPLYDDVSGATEVETEPTYAEPTNGLGGENEQFVDGAKQSTEPRNPGKMEVRWKFRIRVKGGAGRGYYGPWLGPWLGASDATSRRRR